MGRQVFGETVDLVFGVVEVRRGAEAALALAYEHVGEFEEARKWIRRGLLRDSRDVGFQRLEFRVRVMKIRAKIVRVSSGRCFGCDCWVTKGRGQTWGYYAIT